MKTIKGEMHIHSVLSPCASLEMGPQLIVQKAVEKGLDFIAITDHNSTKNLAAFQKVCENHQIDLLYGIEVESKEEVHILCYFDNLSVALEFGETVYNSLMPIENEPELFGHQVIVDHNENIIAFEERLLLQRSSMGIAFLVEVAEKLQGFCIPAHIDRGKNGLLRTLGFLPLEPVFPVLEVSKNCDIAVLKNKYRLTNNNIFKGCDAHSLEEIGNHPIYFNVAKFSLKELKLAFMGKDKRNWFQ